MTTEVQWTVDQNGRSFKARGPLAAWRVLVRQLSVTGPRTLAARGPGESFVQASLYDDRDVLIGVHGQKVPWPKRKPARPADVITTG
jgi:hypothetical protein